MLRSLFKGTSESCQLAFQSMWWCRRTRFRRTLRLRFLRSPRAPAVSPAAHRRQARSCPVLTAEEEQRLEEGMRHQMVDAGRKRPAAIFPDTTMVRFGGFQGGGPKEMNSSVIPPPPTWCSRFALSPADRHSIGGQLCPPTGPVHLRRADSLPPLEDYTASAGRLAREDLGQELLAEKNVRLHAPRASGDQ